MAACSSRMRPSSRSSSIARGRALPAGAVVVRGRRHAQDPADGLDAEAAAVLVDERGSPRSVCVELLREIHAGRLQDLVRAAQLIDLAPQLLISSRSAVVGRSGRVPLSASACRTRLRNTSELTPRSLATCAIGRPDSNTSRTPRSSNSSGYFRGLAIVAEHPFRPGHHPGPQGLRRTRDGSRAVADVVGHRLGQRVPGGVVGVVDDELADPRSGTRSG